jgi:hypothetical protein
VTVAGDLQSEAGCASDWDPACAATHLTYDAADDVWQRTFSLPAGTGPLGWLVITRAVWKLKALPEYEFARKP